MIHKTKVDSSSHIDFITLVEHISRCRCPGRRTYRTPVRNRHIRLYRAVGYPRLFATAIVFVFGDIPPTRLNLAGKTLYIITYRTYLHSLVPDLPTAIVVTDTVIRFPILFIFDKTVTNRYVLSIFLAVHLSVTKKSTISLPLLRIVSNCNHIYKDSIYSIPTLPL